LDMRSVSTWFYITAALLLFAVLTIAGCSVQTSLNPSPVVKVTNSTGHGSGVGVGDGIIVTAAHVVGEDKSVKVKSETGEIYDGEVLWASEAYDIAFVRVKDAPTIGKAPIVCREPIPGEEITIRGNPRSEEHT